MSSYFFWLDSWIGSLEWKGKPELFGNKKEEKKEMCNTGIIAIVK